LQSNCDQAKNNYIFYCMKYITLVENSNEITDGRLKKLFLSKTEQLERIIFFFERKEIEATIKLNGTVKNRRLYTTVEVVCNDLAYKKAIEESIRTFNIIFSDS
jgi:hypothetical protein